MRGPPEEGPCERLKARGPWAFVAGVLPAQATNPQLPYGLNP